MAWVLIGGVLGLLGAAAGLVAFDLSWTAALAIWAGGGPAGALVAALQMLLRPGPRLVPDGRRRLAPIP